MTCPDCNDLGVVIDLDGTYACHCGAGAKAREPWYWPSDKNKERPIRLRVWPRREPVPMTGRDKAAGERDD